MSLTQLDPKTSAFKVLVYLTFKDRPMKPLEITKGLDVNGSTVRARLAELKKNGLVETLAEGYVSRVTSYDILMKLTQP